MVAALRVREGDGRMAVADPLTQLYVAHYRSLVRLAAYLTGDSASAEEVVQDAYVKVLARWGGVRDLDKGAAYLRQAVVNLSRSAVRHRRVVDRHAPAPDADADSAEAGALTELARAAVVAALAELPLRQREALVLRYYADLSEAQTAHAMGISTGAVKSHTSRGIAALRHLLEEDT
jgi:RNA polymerase sigma-70 factor (sigma-E family)